MKKYLLIFLFTSQIFLIKAQTFEKFLLPATFTETFNPLFLKLLSAPQKLRENIIMAEEITDLVQCFTVDSILKRKTQRHRVIGSPFIDFFGYNWRAVNGKKIKVVGTVGTANNPPEKTHYREYDINYNLFPHVQKYIDIFFSAYIAQKNTKKAQRLRDTTQVPFIYPTTETLDKYRMHCECSPSQKHLKELNEFFYPVITGTNISMHPNFKNEHPTMGMYGAFALDCNHSCHPEIHPYEWLWWLDLNPDKDKITNKISWMVGFLRDVAQRQRAWVKKPRAGSISFPFVFRIDNKEKYIFIEHLVNDKWRFDGLKKIKGIPDSALNLDFETIAFEIGKPEYSILIKTNKKLMNAAAKFWLSGLNVDEKNGIITGFINLAMAVENVYAGRITMSK